MQSLQSYRTHVHPSAVASLPLLPSLSVVAATRRATCLVHAQDKGSAAHATWQFPKIGVPCLGVPLRGFGILLNLGYKKGTPPPFFGYPHARKHQTLQQSTTRVMCEHGFCPVVRKKLLCSPCQVHAAAWHIISNSSDNTN